MWKHYELQTRIAIIINSKVTVFFLYGGWFLQVFCLCFGVGENLRHCFAVSRLFKKLFDCCWCFMIFIFLVLAFCYFGAVPTHCQKWRGVFHWGALLFSLSARCSWEKGAVSKSADRFTLAVLLEWLSVPSLLRSVWRKLNSPPHRARCCEYFHPLPIRNSEWPFAVLPPCFWQPPQTLPWKCTAFVLCKLSSLYSQNLIFNNLYFIESPFDNLRWVSQKWCEP